MSRPMRTMTINQLVNYLSKSVELKLMDGDLPVFLAGDSEGNLFGTIDPQTSFAFDTIDGRESLCIYPLEAFYDEGEA